MSTGAVISQPRHTWSTLPFFINSTIFNDLPYIYEWRSVIKVCKRWRQQFFCYRKKLHLCSHYTSKELFRQVTLGFSGLTSLDLSLATCFAYRDKLTFEDLNFLHSSLLHLNLSGNFHMTQTVMKLQETLPLCNLQVLELDNCIITPESLMQLLRALPELQILSLAECGECWQLSDQFLSDSYSSFPNLHSLNMAYVFRNQRKPKETVEFLLRNFPNVRNLNLCLFRTLRDSELEMILEGFRSLELLDLSYCEGIRFLLSSGKIYPLLTRLDLMYCKAIREEGWKRIEELFPNLVSLTSDESEEQGNKRQADLRRVSSYGFY
jgi:hypothetical protein